MRIIPLLALVLIASASLASAQTTSGTTSGTTSTTGTGPCADSGSNATRAAVAEWRLHCAANMTRFRLLSIESFNENKTLALVKHEDNLSRIRTTFLDGKLAAFQDCLDQAAPYGRTARGPHDGVFAACMKERLPSLRANATAAHQAERAALVAAIQGAKDNAKAQFSQMRDAWLAANPKP